MAFGVGVRGTLGATLVMEVVVVSRILLQLLTCVAVIVLRAPAPFALVGPGGGGCWFGPLDLD